MSGFIELAKEKGMADTLSTVCATGGGAYKFEQVNTCSRFTVLST
jgi:type II pantothenate kinase